MNLMLEQEIEEVTEHDGFKLKDIEGVNWAFRKIRAYETKKAEIDDLRAKELERINLWHKKETEQLEGNMEYFKGLITEYYIKLKENDPKAKISTPNGKISSRKQTKYNYIDEEALLSWVKENHKELVKVKEELDKAEFKKVFKSNVDLNTGEIIPGLEIKEEETIQIKVVE